MWQFGGEVNFLTSKKIPGIGSNVADQNYCYKDYPTIIKSSGLNGFEKNYLRVELPFYIKTLGKGEHKKITKYPFSNNLHSSKRRHKIQDNKAFRKWRMGLRSISRWLDYFK